MKRIATILLVTVLVALFIGCSGGGAGDGGGGDTSLTLSELISTIPEFEAKVPDSFSDSSAPSGNIMLAIAPYDDSGQQGVIGGTMESMMINAIGDLNKLDARYSHVWSRVFIRLLKDQVFTIASAGYDTDINLGTLAFPAGTYGPNDQTSIDWGSVRIAKVSSSNTEVKWTTGLWEPFGDLYILMRITELGNGNLEVRTHVKVDLQSAPGTFHDFYTAYVNEATGVVEIFLNDPTSGPWYFTQYTDNDGYLRSMFTFGDVGSDSEAISVMIADSTGAGVAGTQYTPSTGKYQNSLESYDLSGHLMRAVYDVDPGTDSMKSISPDDSGNYNYSYPLLKLKKSGYTLTVDDSTTPNRYWLDFDTSTPNVYDAGTDIDLEYYVQSNSGYLIYDKSTGTSSSATIDTWFSTEDLPTTIDNSALISQMESLAITWHDSEKANIAKDYTSEMNFPADVSGWPVPVP